MKSKSTGVLLILVAGTFWGSMGLFVRRLQTLGFTPVEVAAARMRLAALLLCLLLLFRDPKGFRLRLRDVPLFLGLGLGSILCLTLCYFTAIAIMPLSTAAILLYTSPIWVMLLSVLLFHEKLSAPKLLALALAFGGCVLVCGLGGEPLTPRALLIGLGAGLAYGLYSILGAIALRRYAPLPVSTFSLIFAGLGSCFLVSPARIAARLVDAGGAPVFGLLLLMALVTVVVPFLSYTRGLRTVEPSRAAIFATVEPVVATLLGALFFHEALSLASGLGIALVLAAVVLLNRQSG